ncbi:MULTISPECIES: hypothetical protein [unclassified Streptomyces]|uniref:hypothetical protein n=1 Tax=unclassified Streptomyces TaxID=2593676 RepID=UPI001BEAFB4D|nr:MULTISPECIES: hypothetical protein [unclassified Streptomyces]MBT2406281.1 hypothetical protein [Streptomyces sp. ISL-21]MBT2607402.1 hypothetical protein [Streptomyces sp. ISL-87]
MNITELLVDLHIQENEATARADELRHRIAHFTAALTETEARLADLATTRKIITELAPTGTEPDPPESSTAYQTIVDAFNQHPNQAFRARELHELLDMPTDEASVNITRSRLGRLTRQGFLTQPGRGRYQKRT